MDKFGDGFEELGLVFWGDFRDSIKFYHPKTIFNLSFVLN
jgi:hypothetical protein